MIFTRTPRSPGSLACPFIAGPKIIDPLLFVGRKDELRTLAARMSGVQPVSVNVVGERRIGKSSLLWQFYRTWEQRVDVPARFAVFYADFQEADPPTEDAFFQLLAKLLLARPDLPQDSQLAAALTVSPFTCQDFTAALALLAGRGLLPVFCLDEFEMLLKRKEQFGDRFLDHLRGLMDTSRLMFIVASRKPVVVYVKEQKLTSNAFNNAYLLRLGEFRDEEADELLLLPSPLAPALELEERALARKWGGRHPYLLQLAGRVLFEAKRDGKNHAWVKKEFAAQSEQLKKESLWNRPLSIKAIAQGYRSALGIMADDAERCRKILLTLVLPLLVLTGLAYALLTGKMPPKDVLDWLLKLIIGK
ncbi:ATP-binding protein [Candidatus Electronema sp. PJ]|uniref:ATP-binding protein n=1 Tax=Candidatus Electronema sp. PJ TaxID=3401572 RepID=UPI003AA84CFC